MAIAVSVCARRSRKPKNPFVSAAIRKMAFYDKTRPPNRLDEFFVVLNHKERKEQREKHRTTSFFVLSFFEIFVFSAVK
jgi:hypothetical protein